MGRAYLSLGSNIAPARHLRSGDRGLARALRRGQVSPVYRTAAIGFDGEDFLNAAAMIESATSTRTP